MSNTKDTPMDYRQLDDFLQTYLPDEYYEDIRAKIVPALQSLLDEQNVSLKLELQKQKKLNAELVKGLESVLRLRKLFEFEPGEFIGEAHEGEAVAINRMIFLVESLIKKSNEI